MSKISKILVFRQYICPLSYFLNFTNLPFHPKLFRHFLPAYIPLYLILSKYTGLVNFVFMFLTVWYPWGSWWGSVEDRITIEQKGTLLILEALCCCYCLLVKCTHKAQRGLSGQLRHNKACFKTNHQFLMRWLGMCIVSHLGPLAQVCCLTDIQNSFCYLFSL